MNKVIIFIIAASVSFYLFFFNQSKNENIPKQKNKIVNNQSTKIITTFGDSLTAGYGLDIKDSYPSILEEKLKENNYNYKVVNSGISGETTAAALRRVEWVLKTKPNIVILVSGANDAFRNLPISETKNNLSSIIEKLQEKNIIVLLGGMKAPRNLGRVYFKAFDNIYPELAKKYDLELIPFFLEGVALKPSLNIYDGIHPNRKGYEIIVRENIFPHLKKII